MNSSTRIEWLSRIDAIEAARWNALLPGASPDLKYPFLNHAFLAALERSGAASVESGWQPQHLVLWRGNELLAALPLYLKTHSYGEYVFDWSWADAWQRSGLSYYPKLLCAIPFTPSTGPRVLIAADADRDATLAQLFAAIRQRVTADALSTFHLLFPDEGLRHSAAAQQFAERVGVQYHWFNRGYASFDDFLAAFSSRKRKNLRKERTRIGEQALQLRVLEGAEITATDWRGFHHFYQLTYAKRSGHGGYLGVDFFLEIGRTLRDQIVLVLAEHRGETVAGALNFKDGTTLYGRYWGCSHEFEFLHFEACYYQGIDYCIRHGLQHFDPGAQGEHKIQRGFEPIETYSLHWIEHPSLRRAVLDFLKRERIDIESYRAAACELLPFRQSD
jgi:predicted N-acyltransferase